MLILKGLMLLMLILIISTVFIALNFCKNIDKNNRMIPKTNLNDKSNRSHSYKKDKPEHHIIGFFLCLGITSLWIAYLHSLFNPEVEMVFEYLLFISSPLQFAVLYEILYPKIQNGSHVWRYSLTYKNFMNNQSLEPKQLSLKLNNKKEQI